MIIVDSNVIIFSENISAMEHKDAVKRLNEASKTDRLVTNTIIVSETYHILSRLLDPVAASNRVANMLQSPAFDFLEFNFETVSRAIKLSRDFKIRINDALIAQQAIELGASILTDNVKDFKKINSLKIVPLRAK